MRKHLLPFLCLLFCSAVATAQSALPVPYFQNFEAGAGGWTTGGTAASWALGTPNKATINGAASGQRAWVTGGLTGLYNNNEDSYIESPSFNFTGVTAPQIEMKIWWEAETGQDGAVVFNSVNNGPWTRVGTLSLANNWYNSSLVAAQPGGQNLGWSGTGTAGSNGWVTAFSRVTNASNKADVRFRILFKSGAAGRFDGVGIDDVRLYGLPDIAIQDLTSPLRACDPVRYITLKLKNQTNQPLDFSAIPVQLQVNVAGAGTGSFTTILDSGQLAAGASMFARVPAPGFQTAAPGVYQYTATATLQGATDGSLGNNTLTKSVNTTGTVAASGSLPLRENFESYAPFNQPADWDVSNAHVEARSNGNKVLQMDNFGSNQFTQATSPMAGYITSNTQLFFTYRFDNQGGTISNLGTNRLQVQVQLDCDTTFTTLYTFNRTNTSFASNNPGTQDLKQYSVSLGQFAGSFARVRLRLLSDANVPMSFMVDDFTVREVRPVDAALEKVEVVQAITACYNNQPLKATVRNEGSQVLNLSVNPITVTFQATGAGTPVQTKVVTVSQGVIPVGGALPVIAPASSFNFSTHGTYTILAAVRTPVDKITSNDTAQTVINVGDSIQTLPFLTEFGFQDFANVPGWSTTFTGITSPSNVNDRWLRQTLNDNSPVGYLTTPPIGPIQNGDFLYFNFRFLNPNGTAANITQRGATIELQASTDCGATFTTIYTLPNLTSPLTSFRKISVPISALAGKNVIFRFEVSRTNGVVVADLDRLEIKAGGRDIGVTAITSPTKGCAGQSTAVPVTVEIENFGNSPISLSSKPIAVTVIIKTGTITRTLTDTIKTGFLAANATLSHTFSQTYNLGTSGQHFFKAFTYIAGDQQHLNDTTTSTVNINQLYSAPYNEPFTQLSNQIWDFDQNGHVRLSNNLNNTNYWVQLSTAFEQENKIVERTLLSPVFTNITPAAKVLIDLGVVMPNSGNIPVPASLAGTSHQLKVQASHNCFSTFTTLFTLNSSNFIPGSAPKKYLISLGSLANQTRLQFRIVAISDTTSANQPDFYVDNFAIKVPSNVDAEVTKLILPSSNCSQSANQQISMLITNRGETPLSNFTVGYSYANGPAAVTEQVTSTIQVGDTLLYTFNTRANLSAIRDYVFTGTVNANGDVDATNNSFTAPVFSHRQSVVAPYTQNFSTVTNPEQVFIVKQGYLAPAPVLAADIAIKTIGANKFVRMINSTGQQTPAGSPIKPAWVESGPNLTTTAHDAWVINKAYHKTLTLCVDATGISEPELVFDLQQTYVNFQLHNWFRVLINGQQISDDFHPDDLTTDPWKTYVFDLSAYGNSQFQITFQAALADEPDPTFQLAADAVSLDNIIIRQSTPAPTDIQVVSVNYTPFNVCAANTQIIAELKNISTKNINLSQTPIKVALKLTGPVTLADTVELNSGIFYSSTTRFITFPASFNKNAPGTYVATVSAPLTGDPTPLNNSAKGYPNTPFEASLPFTEDFNNFISFGWDSSDPLITIRKKLELTFQSTVNNTRDRTITLPKVGPITPNTFLEFDYANFTRIIGSGFSNQVTVQASTDCGYTFTNLLTFNSQQILPSREYTRLHIPVGAFAGQNVRFRLVFHYISGDFNINIDNIQISDRATNLEVSRVVKPTTGCTANERVVVDLTNRTFSTYNFSQKPVLVYGIIVMPNGTQTTLAPVTLNSGTLLSLKSKQVQLSSGFNFTQTGVYQIKTFLKSNTGTLLTDTMQFLLPRYPASTVPFLESFEQIALDSLPQRWYASGNVTLFQDLYNKSLVARLNTELGFDTAVIQMPKVALPAGPSYLKFHYALIGNGFSSNSNVFNSATSRVEIQASTNCGNTFTTLRTINRQNHLQADTLQEYFVPLANFANQDITIRFVAYRGGMTYTFQLDSVRIEAISGKDASAISFLLPEDNGCTAATQQVKMIVRNAGPAALTNIPLRASVNGILLPSVSVSLPAFTTDTVTVGTFNASAAGLYALTGYFTLADDMNQLNDTVRSTIQINPRPVVNLPPTVCAQSGQSEILDAGPGWLYLWNTGATTQTITVTTNGLYTVTVTNPNTGCSATDQSLVSFSNLPNANLGADTTVCGSILLSPVTTTGVTYLWSTGATTPTITATASGTYWVKLTKPNGCSATDTIAIITKVAPNANLGPDRVVCTGQSATFLVPTAAGQTYQWINLATGQQVSNNSSYTTGTAGQYQVTVSNSIGCTSIDTIALQVVAQPTVDIGPDTAFCTGSNVVLQATPPTGFTYVWMRNNVVIPGATASTLPVNQVGTYTVILSNGANCSGTDSVTVTQNIPPVAVITQNGTLLSSSPGASYQWYQDSVLIPGATGQTFTATVTGNYYVAVTDNGCTTLSAQVSVVTGIDEELADSGITLFPNPAVDQVELQLSNQFQGIVSVRILNAAGQEFRTISFRKDASEMQQSISLLNISSGFYIVEITQGEKQFIQKLIITE